MFWAQMNHARIIVLLDPILMSTDFSAECVSSKRAIHEVAAQSPFLFSFFSWSFWESSDGENLVMKTGENSNIVQITCGRV